MFIDSHSVHFSCGEAFQILHDRNLKLWEQGVDLLADVAEEVYSETPIDGKEGDWVTGNGIELESCGVFWSNKDVHPSQKWEEEGGQE